MVHDGSYRPNMNDNRGAAACIIYCSDTEIYAWE